MEKNIIKHSINGLIKTLTGNVKPLNDNASLKDCLGFTDADLARLIDLIDQNFLLEIEAHKIPETVSLNQLIDIVVWEVQHAA